MSADRYPASVQFLLLAELLVLSQALNQIVARLDQAREKHLLHAYALIGGFAVGLSLIAVNADAETSTRTLREHGESMNLQMITLRGVVHLTRHREQKLGGICPGVSFILEDETGSIEIAVRRSHRLLEPLKEGDRVKVEAHVNVVRSKDNRLLRSCVMAREVEHLDR